MRREWAGPAWMAACAAASTAREKRKRWPRQAAWDAEHLETVSTRLPIAEATRLRRYCKEAGISRYTLLNYMVRAWMAAWSADHEEGERDNDGGTQP